MTHYWKDSKPRAADRLSGSLRKIPDDELRKILESHETWVRTDGARGFPAELTNANLRGQDFSGMRLDVADMSGACLEKADFSDASLGQANLKEANLENSALSGADFGGAFLSGAKGLETADLKDADFTGAQGLHHNMFAGQDLSGVVLPQALANFAGVQQVNDTSKPARSVFLGLIGACLYAWLANGTATDAHLIVNAASAPLPIIQAPVPLVGFFILGPAVLLAMYLTLHLYLQTLWQEMGALPAIFPDGRPLHMSICPWLLTCLALGTSDGCRSTVRPHTGFRQYWPFLPPG